MKELVQRFLYFYEPNGTLRQVFPQSVNSTGKYAYVTLTETTVPNINNLSGTVFILSEEFFVGAPNVNVPVPPPPPTLIAPPPGAIEFSIDPTFIWTQTEGSYDFQISTSTTFAILTANASRLVGNTFRLPENLAPGTTYFWRVRSSKGDTASPWTTAAFTTVLAIIPPHTVPPRYTLTVNTTGLGFAKGAGAYDMGTVVVITALPEPGWQFSGWAGDAVANANAPNTTIVITAINR